MLQFIIDGYNLVHKIPSLKSSHTPCQDLVSFICRHKLAGSRNNRVLVVFDGGRPPYPISSTYGYKIVFSRQKTADEVIIEKVEQAKNKPQIVVVSDDKELCFKIKSLGAKNCSVKGFTSRAKPPKAKPKKDISYPLQRQITEELRKIWLDGKKE